MIGNTTVKLGEIEFSQTKPFVLIAGPCQMESRAHAFEMATALKEMCARLHISLIYKSSYDKANRTSLNGKRGIGLAKALDVFAEIKASLHLHTLTDVHEIDHCKRVGEAVDILQIPAFLCRQTDLLIAAAQTNKIVNVKKGQFLAPWDMKNVVEKLVQSGNSNVLVTERGASFGYNTLVTDFRGLPVMAEYAPVVFDATHSVQQPGGQGGSSGGQREFVPVLARAALAVGVAGLFIETHQDPDNAPSDGPNMIALRDLEVLLKNLQAYDKVTKNA